MPQLFDASALVDMMMDPEEPLLPRIRGGSALDLTAYEVGAAFWKFWRVRRTMTFEDASGYVDGLPVVFGAVNIIRFDDLGIPAVSRMAKETGLTLYDSAYVAAAQVGKLELVSSDEKVRRGATARGLVVRSPADV